MQYNTAISNSVDSNQAVNRNIVQLFEQKVDESPENEALVFQNNHWTYGELNKASNKMARYLQEEYGAGKGTMVGIITDKSDLTIVSILAVLKTGAAFVPMDPGSPVQRIKHIVGDTSLKVLLMQSSVMFDLPELSCPLFAVDLQLDALETDDSNLNVEIQPTDLAYVIYTSGTSGLPKGVLIEAGAIENYASFVTEQFSLTKDDKTVLLSSLAFDLGYTGLFGSLVSGGAIHLMAEDFGRAPEKVFEYIISAKITYIKTTPSLFFILTHLPSFERLAKDLKLRLILLGGEPINCEDIELYWKHNPDTQFVNHYGPTETTVGTVFCPINSQEFAQYKKQPVIGKPITNNKVVIMNNDYQLSPVGIPGEICVSGKGLARGYLNNPELTHEKFFMAGKSKNIRLYKTGDFGKWLSSGNLAFMGRKDNQVKIKGYRVEVDEIVKAISGQQQVVDVRIIVKKDKQEQKYLVAYLISEGEQNESQLRSALKEILPEYMIPSYIVYLEQFPVTANGKLDEKALPDPRLVADAKSLKQPTSELEKMLKTIWEDVLGKAHIGVDQSFFEIGGDSIKAIQVASKAYEQKYKLEVKDIFQFPTIEQLAVEIKPLDKVADQAQVSGTFPLTPIQKRFFEGKIRKKDHYNQSVMLYSEAGFSEDATRAVFVKLVQHHDMLRASFKTQGVEVYGEVAPDMQFDITTVDLTGKEDARQKLVEMADQLQSTLKVDSAPLMRLNIFKMDDGDRLLIVVHHLIVDGVSWRILFEDIGTLYQAYAKSEALVLPDKTHSYKEWSEKLLEYSNSETFKREHTYWDKVCKQHIPTIPYDKKEQPGIGCILNTRKVGFTLSSEITSTLLNEVNRLFKTSIKDILLTGLALAVRDAFGIEKVLIEQEGHGREEILEDIDISRTVGWFTSKYPILLHVDPSYDLGRSVIEVKEYLRKVPYNGIGYGILKFLTDNSSLTEIQEREPQISFNYLGQFDSDIRKSSFAIANEPCGNQADINEERPYDLDISGMVAGQELTITINYSEGQFEEDTIRSLGDHFKNALSAITSLVATTEQQLTPSDYLYKNISIDKLVELQNRYDIEDIYPLSPMQQGLFYHSLLDPTSTAYYNQTSYRINGSLNPEFVESSFNYLFQRHDVFRGIFIHKGLPEPVQLILKNRKVDFNFLDYSDKANKYEVLELFKNEDRKKLIDLGNDVLLRITVIRLGEKEYELIWNDHHILKDGWSTGIIMSGFLQVYYQLLQNKTPELPAAQPYKLYLQWLQKLDFTKTRSYWKEFLSEYDQPVGVSVLRRNQREIVGYEKREKTLVLDEDKTKRLEELARKCNVTLNTVVQTVWGVLLAKYNRVQDLVFGNVVSGRPAEIREVDSMVGLFINTIPVRVQFNGADSFETVVKSMQVTGGESAPHHYLSLAEIQSFSALKQDLIDHVLIFDNYPIASRIEGVDGGSDNGMDVPRVKNMAINDHAHYDFSIVLGPSATFSIKFDYNALVFEDELIDHLLHSLSGVVDQVISRPTVAIEDIRLWEYTDIQSVLAPKAAGYEPQASVIELFEKQVQLKPDNVALTFGDTTYTYRQLNEAADKLAFALKTEYNIRAHDLVGVMLETSQHVIIAMLGVMKCGAAFVSIDREAPAVRRKYMIEDTALELLILQSEFLLEIAEEGLECQLMAIDLQLDQYEEVKTSAFDVKDQTLPAYVIYTSGTTGVPKGVLVGQQSLLNYVHWFKSVADLGAGDSSLLLTSHVYDLGFTTIFGTLLSGANLHLYPGSIGREPEKVLKYLGEQQISFIKGTPSIFYMLTHLQQFQATDLQLKWVFLGGEKIKTGDIVSFHQKYPKTRFVNHYGPTEATIGTIAHVIENFEVYEHNPVIGRAIANAQALILDEKLCALPPGAVGEICISGEGLAKGYLNRPELTADAFVEHPFRKGQALYKTGDLGKLDNDGTITILGRSDNQVKINGYRVEPAEVSRCLLQIESITDAAVRVIQNQKGENELIAYCVSDSFEQEKIRLQLAKALPAYMMPHTIVSIDKVPFNANGKLDVKALPEVKGFEQRATTYKEPSSKLEEDLVKIWSEILERPEIGVTDNFFAHGGDSIKAVRLVGAVNTSLDLMMEVKDLFEYQNIESLAVFLQNEQTLNQRQSEYESAVIHLQEFRQDILNRKHLKQLLPAGYEEFFPMSDIQLGMLYHGFINPEEGVYHQEKFSQFRDSSFDFEVFRRAVDMMRTKHPMLRTTFDLRNFDVPIQIVHGVDHCDSHLSFEDLSGYTTEKAAEYLQEVKKHDLERPYGKENEVLWRLYMFKLSQEEYGILFSYHHAILDGWSEASFYTELSNCYFGLKADANYKTEPLQANYKDYVLAQLSSKRSDSTKAFWQEMMSGYERTLLPFNKKLDKLTDRKQSVSKPFILDKELVRKLDRLSEANNLHVKQVFLAAYLYLLKITTGKNDVTIGLVTNCRPEKVDGDKVLGCFLNTIPFRYQFKKGISAIEYAISVAQHVNDLRNYDKYPLPDIIKAIGEETGDYNPIFDNRFDYVDFYVDKEMHGEATSAKPLISGRGNSDHTFSLNVRRSDEEIAVRFFFLDNLYSSDEIDRIEQYYKRIFSALIEAADNSPLLLRNMLPENETETLLNNFNHGTVGFPQKEVIQSIFDKIAQQYAENTAVVCGDVKLNYTTLNEKANRIAHYLRNEIRVQPDELVGVMVGRNEMIPVMVLGVLKSGAAYLPVDPDHPAERNAYILSDAKVKVLLTESSISELPDIQDVRVINVDEEKLIEKQPTVNPPLVNKPADMAYVIYTSGSTGQPKGVVVEHRNVVRLFFNDAFQFSFSSEDVWSLFHSICFDFSVWEIFGALLFGGKLVVVPKEITKSPTDFVDLLVDQQVTVLNQIPTMFDHLIAGVRDKGIQKIDLRYVIFGGAALKPGKLAWWIKQFPQVKMINMYGITETTVHVTFKEIDMAVVQSGKSNIGTPIPTLQTHIMDDELSLMPFNVPGEITVGGEGVARGYLNRPELTHERFTKNPYNIQEKLYLSGDIGVREQNGDITYLGRKDAQVKLRGFRIEIGEIENAILKYKSVQEAMVLLSEEKEEEQRQLIAYIVSPEEQDVTSLRTFLADLLPDYMIPAHFIQLDEFPLTANKKVDKKALMQMQGTRIASGVAHVAAENDLQQTLIDIWQEELKVKNVGINDNFFALGGDSLKAIRLVSRINSATSMTLKIADLFNYTTIKELSTCKTDDNEPSLEEQSKVGYARIEEFKDRMLAEITERQPEEYEDIYPLTPIESGMIYSSILNKEHPVYYDQFTYKLAITDYDKFHEACSLMVERHDILRTAYYLGTFSEPVKVVRKTTTVPITKEDLSSLSEAVQKQTIKSYLKKDLESRLKFEGEILWHMKLFQLSANEYYLVWNFHHSILDGWSISQFKIELSKLLSTGKPSLGILEPLKSSYKDYCAIVLGRQISENTKKFWKEKLDGYTQNKLPFNYSGKQKSDAIGAKITQTVLPPEILEGLERLAGREGVSFKSICLAAHVYLMHVICSEDDIVTGVVSHDRQAMEDGDKILGCFLNTIPIRMNVKEVRDNLTLIRKTEEILTATRAHEIHLTDIARTIGEKTSAGNPIFDTILNYTDFHVLETWNENKTLARKSDAIGVTKGLKGAEMTNTLFDVEVSKTLGRFAVRIKYRSSHFEDDDVKRALDIYVNILQYFVNEPGGEISTSPLLGEEDLKKIVYDFNDTVCPYSEKKGLHQLFEEIAAEKPHLEAIKAEQRSLSYGMLNEKANRLAWKLINAGIQPENNVGLIVRRNENMIIGMLAILKAGAAYVPVDPEYPVARQEYILSNSSVKWTLTDEVYEIEQTNPDFNFIAINDADTGNYSVENTGIKINPEALAYTVYTSGSTGKPKGVMIEHRSAVNLIEWVNNTFEVGEEDRLLFITSMCFDLSVYDIFGILSAGGTIVMATKQDVENFQRLKSLLSDEKITFWDSVPTTMNYLVNELEVEQMEYLHTYLRLVFMSGDWIPVNLPERLKRFFPNAEVISLGGATEGTVWSNYYPVEEKVTAASIPYGKPIANNFFYILDADLNPVPEGVVGELYIGGIGVARGYANDREKTAYSFVDDPFNKQLGGRMYRTGDLGRMLPDGNMEFIGRKDHQTKIRGYRVELGEIQSLLVKHDRIKEAAVVVLKDANNDNYLCAYVATKEELGVDEIRNHLERALPAYMIPSHFHYLDALPLTSNGKIDWKKLPEPDQNAVKGNEYVEPGNELESTLAAIMGSILGKEQIGIYDNFLDLGAHSLNIGAFVNRVHQKLNVELNIREVFMSPTVRGIAALIESSTFSEFKHIDVIEEQEYYEPTHAQKRFWFLQEMQENQIAYNMPSAYLLKGKIDVKAIEKAFLYLVQRHESLRTTFVQVNGELKQKVNAIQHSGFGVVSLDLRPDDDREKIAHSWAEKMAKTTFDMENGPLVQTMTLQLEDKKFVLLFSMHHIISDGWSKGVFLNELMKLYQQITADEKTHLRPLKLQYKDYSAWQNETLSSESLENHRSYWTKQFREMPEAIQLPYDFERPPHNSYKGNEIGFVLDLPMLNKIKQLGQKNESSLFMVALAAVNTLLHKITGQYDFVIGTPVAGRDHQGLDEQIGLYLNTLALRTRVTENSNFTDILKQARQTALEGFEHQIYPFDQLINDLNLRRNTATTPLFNVWMVLQNMGDTSEAAPQMQDMAVTRFANDFNVSRYDLRFTFNETSKGLMVSLNYSTDLFKEDTARKLLLLFETLMKEIVETPEQSINAFKADIMESKRIADTGEISPRLVRRSRGNKVSESLITESFIDERQKFPRVISAGRKDIDLKKWMADNKEKINNELWKHGTILFRGFNIDGVNDFEDTVSSFGGKMLTYDFASTPRTQVKGKVYTSTEYPADQEIVMHNEMAYTNSYPDRLWFYCHLPAAEGGETPIADSRTIYNQLDDNIRQRFESQRLKYVRHYHEKLDLPWQKVFRTDKRSEVETFCDKNGIEYEWLNADLLKTTEICDAVKVHPVTGEKIWFNQAHLFHISNIDEAVRNEIRDLVGDYYPRNVYFENGEEIDEADLESIKATFKAERLAFPWQQNDILLVDNLLAAHGRLPYKGDRKVIVAMTK